MKLTPHLISTASSYINPVNDRVLILRGLKVEAIENFGVTSDLNETVDLTDNEISYLGGFSKLNKLKTLLVAHNNIEEIDPSLANTLPNLAHLNLNSNYLKNLPAAAEAIAKFSKLRSLVLKNNPLSSDAQYRLYLIWKVPSLQILDFEKVRAKEREAAKIAFENDSTIITATTVNDTNEAKADMKLKKIVNKLTDEERAALEEKLMNATNLDEIEMIENALKNGFM